MRRKRVAIYVEENALLRRLDALYWQLCICKSYVAYENKSLCQSLRGASLTVNVQTLTPCQVVYQYFQTAKITPIFSYYSLNSNILIIIKCLKEATSLSSDSLVFNARTRTRCNVGGKRAAHASESPTPPTLRTSTDVYLNNAIV
jgi:hypothetical protein